MKSRFVELRMVRRGELPDQIVSDDVITGYWEFARCKTYVTITNVRQKVHLNVPVAEFCHALEMAQSKTSSGAVRLLAIVGSRTSVMPVIA